MQAAAVLAVVLAACSLREDPWPGVMLPPPTVSTSTSSTSVPLGVDEGEAVRVGVGDDLGSLVDAAEPGTTFVIASGLHRLATARPKDKMTFVGEPGTVLSGAMLLEGFVADGAMWRVGGLERSDRDHGSCVDGYDACGFPQDVFMDDVMLWQVTSPDELGPGRWMWDGDAVVVADDPTSRRVELSVAAHAFRSAAADVTIVGLVVEKYATPAQGGAIQAQEPGDGGRGVGWLIEDVEVRLNHGAGLRTGDGTVVRRVFAHHNGQLGITVSGGTDVLVEDSVIAHNNIAGFKWGWEAGGLKATRTLRLVVRGVTAEHNQGPGLWTDIDAVDTLYEANTVRFNAGPGIFHEISYDAVIRDNLVEGNGFDHDQWLWGAGILVAASSGVEIHGNEVRGNHNAITLIQQDRGEGLHGPYLVRDVRVHGNVIIDSGHIGAAQDVGDNGIFDRHVRFEANTYVGLSGRPFAWLNRFVDRRQWVRFGHDLDGTWQ
jgi:hypothetical protein